MLKKLAVELYLGYTKVRDHNHMHAPKSRSIIVSATQLTTVVAHCMTRILFSAGDIPWALDSMRRIFSDPL